MQFTLSEEQRLLRDAVRDLLDADTSHDGPVDARLLEQLAQMGLMGLTLAEEFGGSGAGFAEWVIVLEECGYAAATLPLLETTVAAEVISRSSSSDLAEQWLPRVTEGQALLSVGVGTALVNFAQEADLLLLGDAGRLHAVDPATTRLVHQPSIAGTRRPATVEWTPGGDKPVLMAEDGTSLLDLAFDLAALGTSALLVGVGRRAFDLAVAYAKEREQFGRPIGTFQAIKHQIADASLQIEFARPLVHRAATSLDGDPCRGSVDVSMAKSFSSEAAEQATRTALQVHGAIGYTWEHDLHVWIKAALALARTWGDARWHRARIAGELFEDAG